MLAAPTPFQEAERLRALHGYGGLDTPPEPAFDELVALAARICGTPISLVSLVDHDRQWFKARHGLALTETPRDISFCAHAINQPDELLIVPDATCDPRFADSPLVTGEPGIRFYAGMPLCTPEGHAIGALCVMDRRPRTLDPDQQEALRVLGRQVMAQLELRRSLNEITLNSARLENSQRIVGLGDWEYDFVHQRLLWSDEVYRILGLARKDNPPDSATFYRRVHPDDLAFVHREKKAAAEDFRRVDFEHRIIRPDGEVRYIHQIAEMIFDDQGRQIRESGTIQDITERKVAEETLRQSEERYRLMFERNPSPMWVFDPKTLEFLAVNDATAALYGYSREEFLRLSALDIRPPEAVPDFLRRTATAPSEFHAPGRYLHRKKDGTVFAVDTFAHEIDFAGRPARLVLAVDMTESDRAAAALRTSEARFRALSESAPLGIFEIDAAGGCIYHNPALAALTGRSLEQNLGQGWRNSIHPEDRVAVHAELENAVSAGQNWNSEHRLLRPDDSVVWVHTLAAPSKNAAGYVTGFVGTVEDITERKRAEEIVQQAFGQVVQNRRKRVGVELAILVGVTAAIYAFATRLKWVETATRWEDENNILHLNSTFIAIVVFTVGLIVFTFRRWRETESELTGRQQTQEALGLLHDELDRLVRQRTGELDHANQALRAENRERKQAEASLLESEERFKFVARAVSDAVWDWNISANTVWWNEGFLATFGFVAGEIESSVESWSSQIHPEERSRVNDSIHHALDTGAESWSAEYRFRRKDGSYAFVQDRGYILRDTAGYAIRMVGGLRDLTEQKKMEAQYLRAQRMESIGTLAGGIAHDLNNVLAPILMSIELLKLDPGTDPDRDKVLDTIHLSCRRGADLVRQVLSFARGMDGERVAIRLRHLINDLEGIICETFPRNIQIVSDVANDLWPITGDPTQLHQVLLNLAVNARDAMPRGGMLTITASNIILDAQYAGTSPEAHAGPHVLLQVTDTGTGIPPEVRERIFEPFFTTKELGKGTGIGLATVHTIVKSHGGFVTVDSEVGRGTTFKIHLPADPALRTTGTQHPFNVDLPHGRDELVLVVDDEASIRDITKQTLEAFGYRVITASDGVEAVALYAKQPQQIAVVLTDMMMPVMDGPATIQVLMRINPSVRIIAASGIDSAENGAKATSAGVKNFLLKPYTAETLLNLVREVIDQPAALAAR